MKVIGGANASGRVVLAFVLWACYVDDSRVYGGDPPSGNVVWGGVVGIACWAVVVCDNATDGGCVGAVVTLVGGFAHGGAE